MPLIARENRVQAFRPNFKKNRRKLSIPARALKHDKKSTAFIWRHTSGRIPRIHAYCSMPHTQKHPVWIAAGFVSGRHLPYLQHGHHQKFVVVRRWARLPRVSLLGPECGSCSRPKHATCSSQEWGVLRCCPSERIFPWPVSKLFSIFVQDLFKVIKDKQMNKERQKKRNRELEKQVL